jgi:hypothetical protein
MPRHHMSRAQIFEARVRKLKTVQIEMAVMGIVSLLIQ